MTHATVPAAPLAAAAGGTYGRRAYHVAFTETEVAAGSTVAITGLPSAGTITLNRNTPVFVTGATIQPSFGRTAAFVVNDSNYIGRVSAAASIINDGSSLRYSGLTDGTLYYRSTPNAGADTSTTVDLDIVEGHI